MPHAVIGGTVELAAFADAFEPLVLRRGTDVLRVDKLFREVGCRALLLEALAIESRRKQGFYIKVTGYDGERVTVRIDPLTHPDRSDGVRALVAEVAARILAHSPGARILKTNLVLPSACESAR